MDANKVKPNAQGSNIETRRWKTAEFRKRVVKKVVDTIVKQDPSWETGLSGLITNAEKFEEKVNASARNEAEYIATISARLKAISSRIQNAEPKHLLSNSSGSGNVLSIPEAGKAANKEELQLQEQVYQKIQRMKNTHSARLIAIHQHVCIKLRQHESSPHEPTTFNVGKYRQHKRLYEDIFAMFRVRKSQITTELSDRVDRMEDVINNIIEHQNLSSNQGKHPADVQSKQQVLPQVLGTQNDHLTKQTSQRNNLCLQEQQVAKQYGNSEQGANQLSIIEDPGKAVQRQTLCAQATEASGVSTNTMGFSSSALIKGSSNLNEVSPKPALISEKPSAAMQRLIGVLTSMSPEALGASIGKIREIVHLNDAIPAAKFVDEPLEMAGQQNQPSRIPQGRKMARNINAMAFDTSRSCASTHDSFNQLTDVEEPDMDLVASKVKRSRIEENCAVYEEIKEINNQMIDCEIVIGEKDNIQSAAGGDTEHPEGLVVKFLFNAVTVNQDLISHFAADKKSIIKPLWVVVPTSYPFSSPVILEKMPLDVSEGLKDLSVKARTKLKFYLRRLDQPLSIGDVAISWEHCAREAIREYAQANGGGIFSSKYGGWEMCKNSG